MIKPHTHCAPPRIGECPLGSVREFYEQDSTISNLDKLEVRSEPVINVRVVERVELEAGRSKRRHDSMVTPVKQKRRKIINEKDNNHLL